MTIHDEALRRHETNAEARERAWREQAELYPAMPCADPEHPCVRRRFPGRLLHWVAGTALVGATIGFVVPLALGTGVGQAVLWGVAAATVLACTLPIVIAEGEDGWRSRARVPR